MRSSIHKKIRMSRGKIVTSFREGEGMRGGTLAADGIDEGRWFGTGGSRERGIGGRNKRFLVLGDSFIPASVTRLKLVTGVSLGKFVLDKSLSFIIISV